MMTMVTMVMIATTIIGSARRLVRKKLPHDRLHPNRHDRKTRTQIGGNLCSMAVMGEQISQTLHYNGLICRQDVMQPIERLHHSHSRSAGPVEPAWGGLSKTDLLRPELKWAQTRIGQHRHLCWNGVRQTEIVGGCHAIDDNARLVAANHGVDNGSCMRDPTASWSGC